MDAESATFRRCATRFLDESEAVIGERSTLYYALKLAEEAGEAIKAFNRYSGLSRRSGTAEELAQELCDTILAAFILAEKQGLTLEFDKGYAHIMTRGFRE